MRYSKEIIQQVHSPQQRRCKGQKQRGAVLILSLIFIFIFSALAISMATISGTNVQIADNQRKVNNAFASAESGLEIMAQPPGKKLSNISLLSGGEKAVLVKSH